MQALSEFKRYAAGIIDAYFVADSEQQIVDFNPLFYGMLPKSLARGLKRKKYVDVLDMELGMEQDLVSLALDSGRSVRFDEVKCTIAGKALILIVSTTPFHLVDDSRADAALIIIRDVTDEATVQNKYRQMLEFEANEKAKLAYKMNEKSESLLQANEELNRLQLELMEYRKGLKLL